MALLSSSLSLTYTLSPLLLCSILLLARIQCHNNTVLISILLHIPNKTVYLYTVCARITSQTKNYSGSEELLAIVHFCRPSIKTHIHEHKFPYLPWKRLYMETIKANGIRMDYNKSSVGICLCVSYALHLIDNCRIFTCFEWQICMVFCTLSRANFFFSIIFRAFCGFRAKMVFFRFFERETNVIPLH